MSNTKKVLTICFGLSLTIVLSISAFANSNCGGGSFDYGYETGSFAPYNDAKVYTKCTPASVHQSHIQAWVQAKIWNGSHYREGGQRAYQKGLAVYDTGWVVLDGYDTATTRAHDGDVDCTLSTCDGNNHLGISF